MTEPNCEYLANKSVRFNKYVYQNTKSPQGFLLDFLGVVQKGGTPWAGQNLTVKYYPKKWYLGDSDH